MNLHQKIKELVESMNIKNVLILLCILVILLVVFQAGILVGYHKADFSKKLGNNYYRTFDMRGNEKGMFDRSPISMMGMDIPGGHGAIGKVIEINLPTFIVATPENIEKVIRVSDDSEVRRFKKSMSASEIKVNDVVVIIGNPNDRAEIEARLIRIMTQ